MPEAKIDWHPADEIPPAGERLILLNMRYDSLITFGYYDSQEQDYIATGGDGNYDNFPADFWAKAPKELPHPRW